MSKYISQAKAHDERAKLRAARRKLKIALSMLEDIANEAGCMTPDCACCTDLTNHESWVEYCTVGNARVALKAIKEVDRG